MVWALHSVRGSSCAYAQHLLVEVGVLQRSSSRTRSRPRATITTTTTLLAGASRLFLVEADADADVLGHQQGEHRRGRSQRSPEHGLDPRGKPLGDHHLHQCRDRLVDIDKTQTAKRGTLMALGIETSSKTRHAYRTRHGHKQQQTRHA